jgi:hypothetical protein
MTPYYMDFKQSGNGIEGTKDQLFFKNNDECLGKELIKDNKVDLNDMNYRDILRFTQENTNIFIKNTVYDYGRSGKGIRPQSGTLKDINDIIEGLWLTYMTLGGPLGWIAGLTGAETGVFPSSVRTDIPNIETIIADIKNEYNENWWIKGDNVKKFPYFKSKEHEVNCDETSCTDPVKQYMCPHTCIHINDTGVLNDGDLGDGDGHTHGYYLPTIADEDQQDVYDKYNGYYLSKNNNNTKYNIKENAISRVSKFLGANLNTHRITGDSKECDNIDELSNTKYYCSGKNGGESDKEYLCKPVKYKIDNIIKCFNDKLADAEDERDSEVYTDPKVYTKLSDITTDSDSNPILSEYYNECSTGEPVQDQGQTTISQGPVPTTQGQEPSSQGQGQGQVQPTEIFNYVIIPAKDSDGNDIKSNTYFHGHPHIH